MIDGALSDRWGEMALVFRSYGILVTTVYEAERADGSFDRRVALKVLRWGLGAPELVRRAAE